MLGQVCSGCQPRRDSKGVKHRSKAAHHCLGNNCICGSCYPAPPITDSQYLAAVKAIEERRTWMAKLGGFYVDNTKALIKMVETGKLKPDQEKKE